MFSIILANLDYDNPLCVLSVLLFCISILALCIAATPIGLWVLNNYGANAFINYVKYCAVFANIVMLIFSPLNEIWYLPYSILIVTAFSKVII